MAWVWEGEDKFKLVIPDGARSAEIGDLVQERTWNEVPGLASLTRDDQQKRRRNSSPFPDARNAQSGTYDLGAGRRGRRSWAPDLAFRPIRGWGKVGVRNEVPGLACARPG